ncbi:RNA polymerase sigma factor [[Clostridium] fimetarium]|uniref:RNA polymerase sigma-70 factor, ECF subfamily n=1 Tax=[Clostridium] fimetarium TaxID=99656 RepID=A0A1I0MB30_9FIRM|nr:sigma-70 family RNA polymerase sigma factor [[Clostridium] fimetarium]SEV85667.1 RNA polymerase sigma-70 factor, ECF subfamily [[Clostridium] fimetarium]
MKADYAGMSFEQVLKKYADTVTRVCIVHCGNQTDAQDCFQNVFLKLYQSDIDFESEAHIRAWLIRVAVNDCTDWYRQFWKRRIILTDEFPDNNTEMTQEQDDSVIPYLMKLPFKYRRILYCHYYEDKKISEMATELKLSENTVKTQLVRGRELLKRNIKKAQTVHIVTSL